MDTDTLPGVTKKFTLMNGNREVDCYLKIATDKNGQIQHIDLTISKGREEMRAYEVLFSIVNLALKYSTPLDEIAKELVEHRFLPAGWVTEADGRSRCYKSICDYVGKYIQRKFLTAMLEENIITGEGVV